MRICVLDDLERAALASADWSAVGGVTELVAIDRHLPDPDELVTLLTRFDVVVAMRERQPPAGAVGCSLGGGDGLPTTTVATA
jgi:hypothetical protein